MRGENYHGHRGERFRLSFRARIDSSSGCIGSVCHHEGLVMAEGGSKFLPLPLQKQK